MKPQNGNGRGWNMRLSGHSNFEGHVEQNATIQAFGTRAIVAAALNFRPAPWDVERNAARLEAMFRQAARRRPEVILAPEGILEGYVVDDVVAGRRRGKDLWNVALPAESAVLQRFGKLARALRTCLCFGFAERSGQYVYNAVVMLDAMGRCCAKHRKTYFSEGHLPAWNWNQPGTSIRAHDTPLGRVGFMICNERFQAPIARTLALDGARLLLVPTFGATKKYNELALLARARENGVPIIQANVGVNLFIDKGETAQREQREGAITLGTVHVPAPVGRPAARAAEREFLRWRAGAQRRIAREELRRIGATAMPK